MVENQQGGILQGEYVCVIVVVLAFLWKKKRNFEFRQRINRSRTNFSSSEVDDQKIIVAIEIQNLFIKYSSRKKQGYFQLEIQSGESTALKKLKGLMGYGDFYCFLQQRSRVKSFLKSLSSLPNVQLHLYTSLHKPFAKKMLKLLEIQSFFPQDNQRYCQEEDIRLNQKKHPSWVDGNTRRVMIVTPNKNDYDQEDKKYFLVLNKLKKHKLLKSASLIIKHIIQKVDNVDNLHAEMDEVKAQIQSDYENQQTVAK